MRKKLASPFPAGATAARWAQGTYPGHLGCATEGRTRPLSVGAEQDVPYSWDQVLDLSRFSSCLQGKKEEKGLNRTDIRHQEELPVARMIVKVGGIERECRTDFSH